MTRNKLLMAAALSLSAFLPSQAYSITVDGTLSDWGLSSTGTANDWLPTGALAPNIKYTVEDDQAPNRGGQPYDAEGLYTYLDSTTLYVALITGLAPNNQPYAPGDFAIDFGRNGSFEFGIETTGANAGSAYSVTQWGVGLWNSTDVTSIVQGTKLSPAGSLIYTTTPVTNIGTHTLNKHYIIEAAIPLSVFAGFSGDFNLSWTMNCANDVISVGNTLGKTNDIPPNQVPEPASWLLLMIGAAGLLRHAYSGYSRQNGIIA